MCFIRKDNIIEISEDRVIHMLISVCASLAAVLDRNLLLNKGTKVLFTVFSMLLQFPLKLACFNRQVIEYNL
jgi:hypothetical protein